MVYICEQCKTELKSKPKTYYKKELHFVFPTPVGVFLSCSFISTSARSLPHARGGVSYHQSIMWL